MNTDPIADLLARIRNGQKAGHASISLPASKMKARVAELLSSEGYVGDVKLEGTGPRRTLTIGLRYDKGHKGVIDGLKRISSPGMRIYKRSADLAPVREGMGLAILSTSKGLMTDKQAREQKLGGDVLLQIW